MSTSRKSSNETRTNADCDNPPREATPDLTDQSSSSTESTDSESESESEFSVSSPTDSPIGSSYKPDLRGPDEAEEPQYRGRIAHPMCESKVNPLLPIHPQNQSPAPNHRRGAAPPIAEGTAPVNHLADAAPPPPEHD